MNESVILICDTTVPWSKENLLVCNGLSIISCVIIVNRAGIGTGNVTCAICCSVCPVYCGKNGLLYLDAILGGGTLGQRMI